MRLKLSSRITEAINLTVLRGIYTHTHTHTHAHTQCCSILSRSNGRTDEGSIFCSTQRNAYSVSDILSCPLRPPPSFHNSFMYVINVFQGYTACKCLDLVTSSELMTDVLRHFSSLFFCDWMPWTLLGRRHRFEWTHCLHPANWSVS